MTPTISISIAHARHIPERRASLQRMIAQLEGQEALSIYIEDQPGKPCEWSLRQWQGALQMPATHCVMLNDDLLLCDDFVEVCKRIALARPMHIVNLYNTHPIAKIAYAEGRSWLTSPDGLIGNAYMMPAAGLRAFLAWREAALTPGAAELLSEDQLINLFAMAHRALIWQTVPALVDHDVSIPSCFGNKQMRRPEIPPQKDMLSVNWETDALHAGLAFKGNHWWLIKYMKPEVRKRMQLIERAYELCADEHVDVRKIA
jgi:hypothetical protein